MHARSSDRAGWSLLLLAVAGFLVPLSVGAQTGWEALREPGTVAVMRHALAPGIGDPAGFELDDCATQRNLDARGRAQARATGEAFRAHGIQIDRVLTSQWCRCRETAELLGLAPVEELPALNSFFADRSTGARQTRAAREFLAQLAQGTRAVLVTHAVNITALTGRSASSGEIIVIKVGPDGTIDVLGEIAPIRASQLESSRPGDIPVRQHEASTPHGMPNRDRG